MSSISDVLAGSPEQVASWRKTLLSSALQWLSARFRSAKEREQDGEAAMLLRVQELLVRWPCTIPLTHQLCLM